MSNYSKIRADHIEFSFWLVFDKAGTVRLARREPGVTRDERAVAMTASLPKSLFTTPVLTGSLTVTAPSDMAAKAEVRAAADSLKQALGIDIDLKINPVGDE